jgi:hypothetical protein
MNPIEKLYNSSPFGLQTSDFGLTQSMAEMSISGPVEMAKQKGGFNPYVNHGGTVAGKTHNSLTFSKPMRQLILFCE